MTAKSIHELAQAFQLGEDEAFEFLFREYFPRLVIYAKTILDDRTEVEDLVQECFIKLWERHIKLDDPHKIKSFLFVTVRNACLNRLRGKKKSFLGNLETGEFVDPSHIETEAAVIKAELIAQLVESIESLPARIRQVCELYYFQGKNEKEISRLLHTSPYTIHFQRHRGIVLLRSRVKIS